MGNGYAFKTVKAPEFHVLPESCMVVTQVAAFPAIRSAPRHATPPQSNFPRSRLARVSPATKAMPKEMLPVVDRPLIQHVVDEAREAGIEHFIFVTGRNKAVIEDHFDRQIELEATLSERGKTDDLAVLRRDLPEPERQLYPPAGAVRARHAFGARASSSATTFRAASA